MMDKVPKKKKIVSVNSSRCVLSLGFLNPWRGDPTGYPKHP